MLITNKEMPTESFVSFALLLPLSPTRTASETLCWV